MIKPLNKIVIVEFKEKDSEYTPGILRPESYNRSYSEAVVVAKADDCEEPLNIGDIVIVEIDDEQLIDEHTFQLDGRRLFYLRETMILCVVGA